LVVSRHGRKVLSSTPKVSEPCRYGRLVSRSTATALRISVRAAATGTLPPPPKPDPLQIEILARLHATPGRPVRPHELIGYSREDVEAEIVRCHKAGSIVGRVLTDNGRIAADAATSLTPSGYRRLVQRTSLSQQHSQHTTAPYKQRMQISFEQFRESIRADSRRSYGSV
jgi:hypothetical protein